MPKEARVKHFLRVCSVLGLLVSTAVWGQSTGGAIQGTVVDPSGAALPGATVTARNMGTGVTTTATCNERRRVCLA